MPLESHGAYSEPARDIPVVSEHDIVVAGAGPAGCAAALMAGRLGAKTLLVEPMGSLGGLATAGLICRFMSTNGRDYLGLWHEFVRAMQKLDGVRVATEDHHHGAFDPELIKHAWDALLAAQGVEILHHAFGATCMVEDGRATGLIAETRGGRIALRAGRVIDCTGDGTVAAMSGVGFNQGADGRAWAMACTLSGILSNLREPEDMDKQEFRRRIKKAGDAAMAEGRYDASSIVYGRVPQKSRTWPMRQLPHGRGLGIGGMRMLKVDPLDPFALTEAERAARRELLQQVDFYRRCVPGAEEAYLAQSAEMIGVRSSRRLHGVETLTDADVLAFRKRDDGIARGSWSIDIWPAEDYTSPTIDKDSAEGKAWQERVEGGDWYDIPFGALVAKGVDNLLMAGRCMSAEHRAEASARIQQTCMATGEAAALGAVMSLREAMSPAALVGKDVADALRKEREAIPSVHDGLDPA